MSKEIKFRMSPMMDAINKFLVCQHGDWYFIPADVIITLKKQGYNLRPLIDSGLYRSEFFLLGVIRLRMKDEYFRLYPAFVSLRSDRVYDRKSLRRLIARLESTSSTVQELTDHYMNVIVPKYIEAGLLEEVS